MDKIENNPVLDKMVSLASDHSDIELVWLYGSRARNIQLEHSDYDLAVAFKSYIDDPLERRLRPELLALEWQQTTGSEVSIVDINQVPIQLAYCIVQDNCNIYSANDFRLMVEEQRIMSKWEIDHCYQRKEYA